jgi:hypothetical protein
MDNKTVFIICNGFDLNLGFATSYSDYVKSDIFQKISLWGNNALALYLRNKYTEANWIDIENELKVYYKNAISNSLQTDILRNARKKITLNSLRH